MASPLLNWFGNIFNPVLNPVFGILLKLPPFWGILIITLIVTLITTLIYKKTTDQEVLKTIREDMKSIRKEMEEFKHDANKIADLQNKYLEKSMIQMKQSMRPMLITMIPVLIIFAWFSTNLAYYPIQPDQNFSVSLMFNDKITGSVEIIAPENIKVAEDAKQEILNNKVIFNMTGTEGDYNLEFLFNNKTYTKDVLITKERKYKDPQELISDENLRYILVSNEPVRVFGLSWFWSYLIMAVLLNGLLRKILKVH
jgi:uncharacterized membrane protein (DUF106 family)